VTGPLDGIRVVELAGIGPGPHAAMILGDYGAEVVRVERPATTSPVGIDTDRDAMLRGRLRAVADLKDPVARDEVWRLVETADILIEGYRPGVAERLGFGPDDACSRNPRLIYGRMTGWGQDGPWAAMAGHDINYLSVTGVLRAVGPAGAPAVPLNLVGDFGGGSMYLVSGILAALVERSVSGRGQVIDAAMVDGASVLAQMMWAMRGTGDWVEERASNLLDGGAPFYGVYECQDGEHMAVGAIEPQFYAELLSGLGLDPAGLPDQGDRDGWPVLRTAFSEVFSTRSRDEWNEVFAGTDACATPVLSATEALTHPHLVARSTFANLDGIDQPQPAPRFSRSDTDSLSIPQTVELAEIASRWSTPR